MDVHNIFQPTSTLLIMKLRIKCPQQSSRINFSLVIMI